MTNLRRLIRRIILEGPAKDSFDEAWFNTEEERNEFIHADYADSGTFHKDNLKSLYRGEFDEDIEDFFRDKRDFKRLWNETVDKFGARKFWEGPKMEYFHSLSYYGDPLKATDTIQSGQRDDENLQDLSAWGFFQEYGQSGNKDEMSTYGIYNGMHQISKQQRKFGILIRGRVTLATQTDAFTESRSKANAKDLASHRSSGLPKRAIASDGMAGVLLFEEEDILDSGNLGECVLDNWSIEAIVCSTNMSDRFIESAQTLAKQYGVPLITPQELGKKKEKIG